MSEETQIRNVQLFVCYDHTISCVCELKSQREVLLLGKSASCFPVYTVSVEIKGQYMELSLLLEFLQ